MDFILTGLGSHKIKRNIKLLDALELLTGMYCGDWDVRSNNPWNIEGDYIQFDHSDKNILIIKTEGKLVSIRTEAMISQLEKLVAHRIIKTHLF